MVHQLDLTRTPEKSNMARLICSKVLFSIYTGLDARGPALIEAMILPLHGSLGNGWLAATNEFNSRLESVNPLRDIERIQKHPLALME